MNFTMGGAVAPSFSERLDFASAAIDCGTSTSTVPTTAPLVLSTVSIRAMQELLDSIPREPFAEFMDEQGMPPEQGYLLVLPERMKSAMAFPAPIYVRFSPLGSQPMIVLDPTRLDFDPL